MILEIDNIELSYDNKFILNGVYIKAEKGRVTGILGRNGSGKSSLLKIIFGHLKPQNKLIRIDKKNKKKPLYLSGKIKYLSQKDTIPKNISLEKVFKLFDLRWQSFISIFHTFQKYNNPKIYDLSGGEKRVVETYLMLMSPGEVVLLDEPFSNIAPLYIETFIKLISQEKKNKVIILTDHMYRQILDISDDIYLLNNTTSTLIKDPSELISYGYLNSL
ncbi:ABC-type Mn2+/Zn2+ transport system, ATPase component [Aquimarina amphilecti]|uniref:ABC-type Mn2+/Zn2+ transport system, ATPase component n=1 Tax=Aquimarina amphilecti TaxID=1038014 RepID=A0A1H7NJV7_AQUAM|nr:ATP-binding cassette domain-containing protein [Aquimarina amphilecti]SEL23773.1 ABC-type Mn2+/Zn2+ transport system, ATPase component [Aquimarina amphilecti]